MSQKKKKLPSRTSTHTRALTRFLPLELFVFWNWTRVQGEVSLIITPSSSSPNYVFGRFGGFIIFFPHWFFWCLFFGLVWFLVFWKPHTDFSSVNSRDLRQASEQRSKNCWGLPRYHLQALEGIGESRRVRSRVLLLIRQITLQPPSTKTSSSLCCMKGGHIPSLRKDANIALFWNTASLVPCSGVCSSDGVLRRPICSADHCLFDVAANVTFLFQSKTQQGVPSVWHRP